MGPVFSPYEFVRIETWDGSAPLALTEKFAGFRLPGGDDCALDFLGSKRSHPGFSELEHFQKNCSRSAG
jgi:hypothetical protein